MVIPSVPQLHESLLGPHVLKTDLDRGAFNSVLVCGPHDKPGALASVHPAIKFDEPVTDLKIKVVNVPSGRVVWDAFLDAGGSQKLPANTPVAGGPVPMWKKICTPQGESELYRMSITGTGGKSGQFDTSVTFTANNAHVVKLPVPFKEIAKKDLTKPLPKPAVTVPLWPDDFNPIKYL